MSEFEFPEDDTDEIEPGSPSLENVAFVLLGALCTIAVVIHVATLFG